MTKRTYRGLQTLLLWVTFLVIASSFYFQYAKGFQPCPLCFMQRVCACALFFFCMLGISLKSLQRAKHVVCFQGVFAAAGAFFALRQLWLQLYAPASDAAACLPGLDMLIHFFPWREVVHVFLWGSSTCADVTWYGLGLSMAAWSALYFGFMLLIAGIMLMWLHRTPRDSTQ